MVTVRFILFLCLFQSSVGFGKDLNVFEETLGAPSFHTPSKGLVDYYVQLSPMKKTIIKTLAFSAFILASVFVTAHMLHSSKKSSISSTSFVVPSELKARNVMGKGSIYHAVLNGQQVVFEEYIVSGAGNNCGFNSLGVEREKIAQKLLDNGDDPTYRKHIETQVNITAASVAEKSITLPLRKVLAEEEMSEELFTHPEFQNRFNHYKNDFYLDSRNHHPFSSSNNDISNEFYRLYVTNQIKASNKQLDYIKSLGLGDYTKDGSSLGVMDLIAQTENCNLRIWEEDHIKPNHLTLTHCPYPMVFSKTIDIIHHPNHYNSLMLQNLTKSAMLQSAA